MNDTRGADLTIVTDAISAVAGPAKTSFLKAISQLLGDLTAIPRAWIRRPAQGLEDITAARSAVTAIIAKAVAEDATKDPVLMQAAAEIYLPTALRKAKNRFQVAQSTAEHLPSSVSQSTESAPPEDDWMNNFMRFAEDASSERLQDLFGRILAGQIARPGSFGAATLRAVSELDQSMATDFSWAWEKCIGEGVDYNAEFQRGVGFSRWKRLSEAGLMATTNIAQFLPPFSPVLNDNGLWTPMQADGVWVNILFKKEANVNWPHIEFTRVGREIGSLLPRPDYEANMRLAAQRLPTQGLTTIELNVSGKPTEVIWRASE